MFAYREILDLYDLLILDQMVGLAQYYHKYDCQKILKEDIKDEYSQIAEISHSF